MSANVAVMTTGTQSMSSCFNLSVERIGYTFAYCLLFAVSLTGNALIGVIVYKTRSLRNPVNYFTANMAISDLLFPIFLIPQVLVQLNTNTWLIDGPLGQALCKLSGYLVDVSSAVSIQSLVIIAVDRFRAVVFPLRSPLISSKRCRFFILATWIIAMVVFCPSLFTWKVVEHPEGLACVRRWKAEVEESSLKETFPVAMTILYLYFPLVFIGTLYLIIAFKMKANKIIGLQSVNVREQRLKRERNVLKMCIAIVLVFAVCWVPFSIWWLLFLYSSDRTISSCGFQFFGVIAVFLRRSNCAANPYICFIFSGNYRQGLKNLFSCFSVGQALNQIAPLFDSKAITLNYSRPQRD